MAQAYQAGLLDVSVNSGSQSETPLLLAIRIGNLPAVAEMLKYPVNFQQQGIYWQNTPFGLSRFSLTPLQVAIRTANFEAVCLLLDLEPSQKIPSSHKKCRDETFEKLPSDFNLRSAAIMGKVLHAKMQKDLRKLQHFGPVSPFVKVYSQWQHLVFWEGLFKSIFEGGSFHGFTSTSKEAYFYVAKLGASAAIVKDKKEQGIGAHWESFIYKIALVINLEELFLPTKKTELIDPKTGQPLKMLL